MTINKHAYNNKYMVIFSQIKIYLKILIANGDTIDRFRNGALTCFYLFAYQNELC